MWNGGTSKVPPPTFEFIYVLQCPCLSAQLNGEVAQNVSLPGVVYCSCWSLLIEHVYDDAGRCLHTLILGQDRLVLREL